MPVRVKMCGITRAEDARVAVDAGASAIGMVFWPGSPRCIDLDRASAIGDVIPPSVMKVGVFVDQPRSVVETAVKTVGLDAIQLHGRERPADYRLGVLVLKAVPVGESSTSALASLEPDVLALLDAADDPRKGGTGTRVDWHLAARAAAARHVVLAGGLTSVNVREAIRTVGPYAVDVSSGIEAAPGHKAADRIHSFLDAVRAEAGDIPRGCWS